MRRAVYLSALFILLSTGLQAQNTIDSVKQTIQYFFTALYQADANQLRECIADSAVLQTIVNSNDGKVLVKSTTVADFIKQVASYSPSTADERIQFETIKTDGPLAFAWTPYQFYWKGQFHHCGVNSFQLIRQNNQWKIQYIIDTRRKENCYQ